jgi:hypothetical protein
VTGQVSWAEAQCAGNAPDRGFSLPSARFFSRIPQPFILLSAASAIALAAAVPGPGTAAAAPVAGHPVTGTRPGRVPALPHRPPPASFAISAVPAGSRAPRYTVTAYTARPVSRAPRRIARAMLRRYHWAHWQFRFLNLLWDRESSWNPQAANPYSGAYGIPQAVPASKMASAGPDWRWSARTQIRWGLRYISGRYGSPFAAWWHERCYGWY